MIGVLARLGRGRSAEHQGPASSDRRPGWASRCSASVTKEFTTVLGTASAPSCSSWTVYVLILSAIVGFVLQQLA